MNAIQVVFASLVMFGGLFVAQPAVADHLRHPENLANTLHHQTVDYLRWLKYHVPECELGPQLRQDGAAVLAGVNHVQQLLLFADGRPGEIHQLHAQVHELRRLVAEVERRVADYLLELKYAEEFARDRHRFARTEVHPRLGLAVVRFPRHDSHRDRAEIHRLRSAVRGLASRLAAVRRTTDELDKALLKAGR